MKLYNTLTRSTDDFQPIRDDEIRMYSCGPTVYDHIHIGNLSAFIFADTLRRVLQVTGKPVHHVMNFTDVDDKTIRRSHERYPELDPKQALRKLTEYYTQIFLDDMGKVGNDVEAYDFVKATDPSVIEGMQELIRELLVGGFAYIADDGIYFSIKAYRDSGKTYGQLTDITTSSTSESRIQNDEYGKESAQDFALWKKQKGDEPAWEFEVDGHDMTGRPGWHIECSVMSSQNLGQPFDIHTGGIDLIFPHHENEIAQSTAGKHDSTYAKYFAHNEHILVEGKKMSKSLNNFYTLQDIIDKGFDPLAFRLLVLQSHYRSQVHFSWENLEAAQNRLQNFRAFAALGWNAAPEGTSAIGSEAFKLDSVIDDLQNDIDTPKALTSLQAKIDTIYDITVKEKNGLPQANISNLSQMLAELDDLFGLGLSSVPDINQEQKQLIAERVTARSSKDWARSDELRDALREQGIGLRDTAQGTIWYWL